MSKPLLTFLCIVCLSGLSRSQFTGPSDGICPGDDVIFTCVLNSTALATTWTVTSGGVASSCTYNQNMPETQSCGPNLKFTSSQTNVDGDPNNSSLSVDSGFSGLNGVSVRCADGTGVIFGSRDICVIDVLESPEILSANVSGLGDEDNMCRLSLEWSEAVSCGGNVTYTLTATPCLSVSGDCEVVGGRQTTSITETRITLSVDGSVGLEYDFTVSTCANTSAVYSVDLTATSTGNGSFYYYEYNNETLTIEFINVTWPRYFVLDSEASYRVVIDERTFTITAADNCREEMCTFIHNPGLFEPPPVAVDIVGCTTERIFPMDISSPICSPEDLLSPGVDWDPTPIIINGQGVYSFPGGNVTYNGVSLGSTATYRTSEDYLVNGGCMLESTCGGDGWTPRGNITNATSERSSANIALIIVGLILFIAGVAISIVVVVLSWPEKGATKNSQTEALRIRCVLLLRFSALFLAIVLPILEVAPWIAAFVYVATKTFTVDDGDYRKSDSLCESPTGRVAVRDGLFIFSFVVSLLIFLFWLVYLVYLLYKRYCAKDPPKSPGSAEEPLEMGETYDVIQRNQPSSKPTQKLLSETDPSYGKLDKSKMQSEEPGHYGKLDRTGNKKTATIAPAVSDAEYGKLDRTRMQPEEPGHYGKLDHAGKTSTLPVVVTGSDEYGKLDRSQMENPLHYGKLDHPGKKGGTLTGGVAPTDTQGYGKLDKTQMQASGSTGGGGEMYDTVSHEPRHQVPSTKSKRQHSSSGH